MVIGPHTGPLEPIIITLGAGWLGGFFQWPYLRKTNFPLVKWLGFWISGLMVGIIVTIVFLMGMGRLFGEAIQYLETNNPKSR